MSEVKISVCSVEMTPDQAKKVYQELGKLFNPTPSIFGPVRSPQSPTDRFPPIGTLRTDLLTLGPHFAGAQKSPD